MMNNVFYNAVLMFDDVQKNQFPSWSGSQGIGKLGLFEIKLKVFGNDHLCMLEMIRLASSHVRHAMLGAWFDSGPHQKVLAAESGARIKQGWP